MILPGNSARENRYENIKKLLGGSSPQGFGPRDKINVYPTGGDPAQGKKVTWEDLDWALGLDRARHFPPGTAFKQVENLIRAGLVESIDIEPSADAAEQLAEFAKWLKGPLKMEKPQHSVCHQALINFKFNVAVLDPTYHITEADIDQQTHSFLIQHNWAALIHASEVTGAGKAEWLRMPYPNCCFELQLSGARVCIFTLVVPETAPAMALAIKLNERWIAVQESYALYSDGWTTTKHAKAETPPRMNELVEICFKQVRAICIMLDTQVAETEVVRAPYNRNAPPKGQYPLPKLSHHIVHLAKRHRVALRPADERQRGTSKRLHFRRGHWRHYATWKTWIKWTLVGNPDLGFVDKEYRL